MLAAYYDRTCDSRALFSDLKIAKDNTFERHLNKYDVIFLDMTIFINTVKDINDIVSYMESQILGELKATYDFIGGETVLLNALSKICDNTKKKFIRAVINGKHSELVGLINESDELPIC
jgi:hypothetical protein